MEIKVTSFQVMQSISGEMSITAVVDDDGKKAVRRLYEKLKNKVLRLKLDIWHEKRSLDANAYAWELMGKLAEVLTAEAQGDTAYSKDDIYLLMLKKYGQSGIVKIRNKDKDSILREVKYYEEHEQFYADNAAYYHIWVGSSNYNTKEMSLFLNGIIAACKELGIDTRTPDEVARMVSLYASAE